MHGIVHFDLPAKNPAGQGEFYNKMFGWKTEPSGNFMIRCYWQPDSSGVVRPSWGGVKELYR